MKLVLPLLLFAGHCFAQTLTIPARTITSTITSNGAKATVTLTIPAQDVPLPPTPSTLATGGSALPAGFTWAGGVFTVPGSISATSISLTGGPALPTCTTGLYLFHLVSGMLTPSCYQLPLLSLPVSQ